VLEGFATRSVGGIVMEATAVVPARLWTDLQTASLKRVVEFVHEQAAKVGIQLARVDCKASTLAMWVQKNADQTQYKLL